MDTLFQIVFIGFSISFGILILAAFFHIARFHFTLLSLPIILAKRIGMSERGVATIKTMCYLGLLTFGITWALAFVYTISSDRI